MGLLLYMFLVSINLEPELTEWALIAINERNLNHN